MNAASTQRHKLNTHAMWALSLLLITLPLILGGNRPMAWTLYALLLSLLAVYYFAMLLWNGIDPRITVSDLKFPTALLIVFCGYIVLQTLPLASMLPASILYLPEGVLPPETISISPQDTLLGFARWINIALTGYLALQIAANSIRAARFLRILFWIAAAHAIYGLLLRYQFGDTILFTQKWAYIGFATGGFVNRNSFATFLAIGSVIGVIRLYDIFRQRPNDNGQGLFMLLNVREGLLLPLLGWLMILIAIVATSSRMGLFASFAGMAVAVGLFHARRSERTTGPLGTVAALGLLIVGATTIAYLYGTSLMERFQTVDQSTEVRMQLYDQIWGMVMVRPWTGFGGGTFEYAYPLFHQSPVNFDFVWDRAHSSYLALWSEYGLIFGTLPMILVLYFFALLAGTYLKSTKADAFVIAAIGATVAVAIHSSVDFSLEMHGVTLFYVALLAGAVGKSVSIRRGLEAG
ncbi:O-antigen ligase family protein [Rhizobium sp. TH2]|uniref:O-antigen ligase family protein n=1 Tax=Rhizobium sp. TH2 TaxID=2775403 RepID=UPI002157BA3A|nr:O-antigen ligase family protein [Rhizobium sp. TH2]UVC08916.1 O-antigen ligase family protein [Rhizobium sp. TH2]